MLLISYFKEILLYCILYAWYFICGQISIILGLVISLLSHWDVNLATKNLDTFKVLEFRGPKYPLKVLAPAGSMLTLMKIGDKTKTFILLCFSVRFLSLAQVHSRFTICYRSDDLLNDATFLFSTNQKSATLFLMPQPT